MRRTQLYLNEDLWNTLHVRARLERTTVSELVRAAVREHYTGKRAERIPAMQKFIGIRRGRAETEDSVEYVRSLRRGARLGRLTQR